MYGLGFLFYKFCFENISIFLAYFAMEYLFMLCLNDSLFFLKPIVVSQKEKKRGGGGGGGGGGNVRSLRLKNWLPLESTNTVDSRYLDPSYLDPITYVELISKSRLFSLCIYCISASRMSNYFYVDTSAISSIIFSP